MLKRDRYIYLVNNSKFKIHKNIFCNMSITMCGNSIEYNNSPNICHGCNKIINDKYLLCALNKFWHEDCLKCACCDCRLGEIGCKLYTKANLILCRKDYLRYVSIKRKCISHYL